MRILITGGSGFLGSHIADAVSAAGHEAVLFDIKPSPWLQPGQRMETGDILDQAAVSRAMAGCGAAYHLAAVADIGDAMASPRAAIETNIIGTTNMLEAAREQKLGRFVFASSIYVYSKEGAFYRTTKRACEQLIADYNERFGLPFTVLRFGSLYGPRADRNNGMTQLLSQALRERRIDHYGTGDEVREYIHVLDAAAMSVDVLAPEFAGQYIHLTGRERMTSRDVLTMIREIVGGDIELNFMGRDMPGHYVQTPYNYMPKLGRRLTRATYIDLGLGLLDCLQRLDPAAESEAADNNEAKVD